MDDDLEASHKPVNHRHQHQPPPNSASKRLLHVSSSLIQDIDSEFPTHLEHHHRTMKHYFLRFIFLLTAFSFSCIKTTKAAMTPPGLSSAAVIRKNVISGAAIFTAGDIAAQMYTQGGLNLDEIDKDRTVSATCIGAIWSGLFVPWLYGTAESILPGKTKRRIIGKMMICCSFLSTAGNYLTLSSRRMMQVIQKVEGGPTSFKEVIQSCNRDIGEVIIDDLRIWPAYDIMCFSLIPPSLRALTTALMTTSWQLYISVVSARPSTPTHQSKPSSIEEKAVTKEKVPVSFKAVKEATLRVTKDD